jgi:hypothetical protein
MLENNATTQTVHWLYSDSLLWSTRGRSWGFRFLHLPEGRLAGEDWDAVYQRVFANNDHVPARFRGSMRMRDGRAVAYVAARFFDDKEVWKDAAGRTVPHEMLLVVETDEAEAIAATDWPATLMDHVRDTYKGVFDLDAGSLPRTTELPYAIRLETSGQINPSRAPAVDVQDIVAVGYRQAKTHGVSATIWERLAELLNNFVAFLGGRE